MSNLFKEKLKGKHLSIIFGTFAGAHLGHYQSIIQAKRETDGCVVVVSGRKGDRGDQIGLDLQKRFRYMRELFAEEEHIYVTYVNEDDIPEYPNGWDAWFHMVVDAFTDAVDPSWEELTWYVGEPEYKTELEKRTYANVKLLDRMLLPISATQIRENPLKHWQYITRPFRRHFSTNILIMGSASNGKSTLVKDIARSLGSPFSEEYAREYEEESNIRDEELTANDFHYLASGMFKNNQEAIQSPANNGIVICDTDVSVTKVYAQYYLTEEEYQALVPTYDLMIAKQKWDLILVVPPVTQYVNDNFRDMSYSDEDSRWKMHQMFLDEIEANGLTDKVRLLDAEFDDEGQYDRQGFHSRYQQARNIIKGHVKEKYNVELI